MSDEAVEEPIREREYVYVKDALDKDELGFTYENPMRYAVNDDEPLVWETRVGVVIFKPDGTRPRVIVPVDRVRRQ